MSVGDVGVLEVGGGGEGEEGVVGWVGLGWGVGGGGECVSRSGMIDIGWLASQRGGIAPVSGNIFRGGAFALRFPTYIPSFLPPPPRPSSRVESSRVSTFSPLGHLSTLYSRAVGGGGEWVGYRFGSRWMSGYDGEMWEEIFGVGVGGSL